MSLNGSRPVIIVTGANSGVGFGICQRLLFQFSSGLCQDAIPKCTSRDASAAVKELLQSSYDGLTLILACRSRQRAEDARTKLYRLLDEHIAQLQSSPHYNGHAEKFRKNLNIAVHIIDLARVRSVFDFADEVAQTYPYVSHIICNAGLACFKRIDWPVCFWQLATDFMGSVTTPRYFLQSSGRISEDGLGWLWQCNLFGHYVLFRALEPHLAKYTGPTGARVVWIGSHEATSKWYDPEDWQLVNNEHSYQTSKYQQNILARLLDQEAAKKGGKTAVRHVTAMPGVAGTNIANALLGPITVYMMYMAFYIARFLGSSLLVISAFKAAIAAVHVAFVPTAFLSTFETAGEPDKSKRVSGSSRAVIYYVSQCDWLGNEQVGTTKLLETEAAERHAQELMQNCNRLLKTFCDAEGRKSASG